MTDKDISPANSLTGIYYRALESASIPAIMKRSVTLRNGRLKVEESEFDLARYQKIFIGGVGTAALPMADYLENLLQERISQGIIVVPPGSGGQLKKIAVKEAGSPLMDEKSFRAIKDLFFILGKAKQEDLVIMLLTKGASELLETLPPSISPQDYYLLLRRLKAAGADDMEINAIRTHLSLTKGGQFLEVTHPATLITLIVSDEPGGELSATYQAPTYIDPSTYGYCRQVLIRYKLPMKLPPSILNYFNLGIRNKIPETVKTGDERISKVYNHVVQSSVRFAADALEAAGEYGLSPSILSTHIRGESLSLGKFFGQILKDISRYGVPLEAPCVFIASGRLDNSEGRRLEELCQLSMSCAREIDGLENVFFLAASSFHFEKQGFSGCMVTGRTAQMVRELKLEPLDILRMRQAGPVLKELQLLLPGKPGLVDCGDVFIMMKV